MSSSTDDSNDDLIELMTLPLIMYKYLNYLDEESSSSDDNTSSCSSVVSALERKRQKVSQGIGAIDTSSHNIDVSKEVGFVGSSSLNAVVATQEKRREKVSKTVGVDHNSSPNAAVFAEDKKRETVSRGVGVVDTSSCNAVVSRQGKKSKSVSEGLGVVDTSSRNAVVPTHGDKGQEVSKGVGGKVSQQLDDLLDAIVNKSIMGKDKPGCSIEEVMKIVEGIPEIVEDDELFMRAADILTDRENREMFIAIKEKNRQIMWLKHKKV